MKGLLEQMNTAQEQQTNTHIVQQEKHATKFPLNRQRCINNRTRIRRPCITKKTSNFKTGTISTRTTIVVDAADAFVEDKADAADVMVDNASESTVGPIV